MVCQFYWGCSGHFPVLHQKPSLGPCQASHASSGEHVLDSGFSIVLTCCRENPQLCSCGGSEKEGKKGKEDHVPPSDEAHIPAFSGNSVVFHVLPHSRAGICSHRASPCAVTASGDCSSLSKESKPHPASPSQSMEQQEKGSVHGNPGTQSSQAESPNCC